MRMETNMKWYDRKSEDVLAYLEAGSEGLTSKEVARRLEHFGPNSLPKPKQESYLSIFARQFASPLIYLLLLAAVIVVLMGEYVDGGIIALVLILNAIIGTIQEGRAVKTLASLQKLVTTKATVLRDGKEIIVPDSELVPGDIVILREGEKVPADCRILEQASLKVNESAITGESVSVEKHPEALPANGKQLGLPDQRNMLFLGTLVTAGNARAVVVATGLDTIMGAISGSVQHVQREIPLQRNIRHLANILILVVLGCSIILFFAGLARGMEMREIFGTVVSLAVSIIPEGLPIAVTLILASGVWRMSKRNALVKKLQAIEALGQVDIIAVDKTGTITQNEMTVVEVLIGKERYSFTGTGYEEPGGVLLDNAPITPAEHPSLLVAGKVFALCGNARINKDEETGQTTIAGDPTDAALVIAAQKIGFVRDELLTQHPLVEELPFDYKRKFHATVHQIGKDHFLSAVGAAEAILPLCDKVDKKSILLKAHSASKRGLRVLAFAYCEKAKPSADKLPVFTFGGLVMMIDPLQADVPDAVAQLQHAGIRVAMLTGDNAVTARAIAESAGIYREGDRAITSSELYKLSDRELYESLHNTTVFARVTPDDKLRLIEQYSKQQLTAGMTGDGVNDAPALLAADIGMAMGRKGTEVAKEAADIVLLDDNFTTIVAAVEEGRNIYLTIKKVLLYLFSTSIGELLAVSASVFMGLPLPVIAVQIIWLNFVTDGFLTVALGMEPKEPGLLNKAFQPSKYLLSKHDIARMVLMGTTMAAATLYLFTNHHNESLIYRQTVALTLLAVVQWFNAWNARTEKSIFVSKPWRNPWLVLATAVVVLLQVLAVYWPPFQAILKTTTLTLHDWYLILLFSLSIFVIDELYKLFRYLFTKRS
jgi:Ca2+-transporting ATPase